MSTKITAFSGEHFHIYHDAFDYLPTIEFDGEKIDAPEDFLELINDLISLQQATKVMYSKTLKLDEVDGGLFSINLSTGEKKEIKDGHGI